MKPLNPVLAAVLYGGLIAGSVDIFAASLINLIDPLVILRFIAGGLLGKPAFGGGLSVSLLGLLLQWLMGILIAAVYVFWALRLRWMNRDWRVTGTAYGVVVYFVMTYVVVPLSALPRRDPPPAFNWLKAGENLLAMILFGLIVAFFARRVLVPRSGS